MTLVAARSSLKILFFLGALCASVVNCFSLDREAFSIPNYDLNLQVDPEQHRLGVRGRLTLRNDTSTPQRVAVLQVSSSLSWRAIKAGDKPVQFITQPFASDIDHTGALSEAIVTLPQPVAPHATADLDIAYEGTIELDATRLTRIGAPEEEARHADWDQISPTFTAVRGAGYVAWYPIATEAANLSELNGLTEVLSRWMAREAKSKMHVYFGVSRDDGERQDLVVNQPSCKLTYEQAGRASRSTADCTYDPLALVTPLFVSGIYLEAERSGLILYYLRGHETAAANYTNATDKLIPLIAAWFGSMRGKVQIADLTESVDAPFEGGAFLLTSLANSDSVQASLTVAHQLVHASFSSPRPWIEEGLAHFGQALYLEQENGRRAALDYMIAHRSALNEVEKTLGQHPEEHTNSSLVSSNVDELYRGKAMSVWWMLRDMVGDAALKKALAAYRPEQDEEPSYMPHLVSVQTQRDLQWFFDDWVFHDRGLPDFKMVSTFSSKAPNNSYILAVTVENLGGAGAEVPVVVTFDGGQVTKRLEIRAKSKATTRIETPAAAQQVLVNDGSVPENGAASHVYKVDPPKS